MTEPFKVYPYSIDKFISLLLNPKASEKHIRYKNHIGYFESYFSHAKAKTILVEEDYIDRDYLEDYAAYYSRCFTPYQKHCRRLHFFTNDFSEKDFHKNIENGSLELVEGESNYLGFIVIKPLPKTVIGRTCLAPYEKEPGIERHYPIIRKYSSHLFGRKLEVDSLAFQEQDHEVAACATNALWSIFQGTGIKFHHNIPSPYEITVAATKHLPIASRAIPNAGLTIEQIAHGIQYVGLEPLLFEFKNNLFDIKSYIYAYLKFGIPVVFGFDLVEVYKNKTILRDKHAVAVVGFRIEKNVLNTSEKQPIKLASSNISKLYVHDDQVGPFARMEFEKKRIKRNKKNHWILSTSWRPRYSRDGIVKAIPDIIMIPLYHKIRIPFSTILDTVMSFNRILQVLPIEYRLLSNDLEWDIYLTDVNRVKSDIFRMQNRTMDANKLLYQNLSKFIWRATACKGNQPLMDLLFDATDIEQGDFFFGPIEYDQAFSKFLHEFLSSPILENYYGLRPAWKIIQWFQKK